MAEITTQARPYAKAIFKIAKDAGDFSRWSETLNALATVQQHPDMLRVIANPQIAAEQRADCFISAMGDNLNESEQHFVQLLAHNRRLNALSAICALYERYRRVAEKRMTVKMTTAVAMTDAQRQRFVSALQKRYNQDIELETAVDETLIGGALIHAGDHVIDGTILGRVSRLAENLNI